MNAPQSPPILRAQRTTFGYPKSKNTLGVLRLGRAEPTNVELKLRALEDVAIGAARLTGAARNNGVETTSRELLLDERVDLGVLAALSQLALNVVALLDLLSGLVARHAALGHGLTVVLLVSHAERSSVNLDNGALHKSVGTDKLVVRGVVNDTKNTRLGSDVLRAPSKVAAVKTHGTLLDVTATNAHIVDALRAKTSVSRLTTELKLPLLAVEGVASTGRRPLVTRVPSNTHIEPVVMLVFRSQKVQ